MHVLLTGRNFVNLKKTLRWKRSEIHLHEITGFQLSDKPKPAHVF